MQLNAMAKFVGFPNCITEKSGKLTGRHYLCFTEQINELAELYDCAVKLDFNIRLIAHGACKPLLNVSKMTRN